MFTGSNVLDVTEAVEERFKQFVRRLQLIDADTERFLLAEGFKPEAKSCTPPCRLVRNNGERVELIDFAVHQDWQNGSFEPELQYSLEAICHHLSETNPDYILTKREKLCQGMTLDELSRDLPELIIKAVQLFREWTPEVVVTTGEQKGQFWSLAM